jgi:hypothetical protein
VHGWQFDLSSVVELDSVDVEIEAYDYDEEGDSPTFWAEISFVGSVDATLWVLSNDGDLAEMGSQTAEADIVISAEITMDKWPFNEVDPWIVESRVRVEQSSLTTGG